MTRGLKALAAVAVVAALVVFTFRAVSQDDDQPRRTASPRSHATVPPAPDGAPRTVLTTYIPSRGAPSGAGGTVAWLRGLAA